MAKHRKPKRKGKVAKPYPAPWSDGFKPKGKGAGGMKRGGLRK